MIEMSSSEGAASLLGWLCTRTTEAAEARIAGRKTSLGYVMAAIILRGDAKSFWQPIWPTRDAR